MNGTLSHSTFLTDSQVETIQREARKLGHIERARSKKQMFFGRLCNEIWDELKDKPEIQGEIFKSDLYIEMSYWINEGQDFPLVGATGETLRRWAETAAKFKDTPAIKEMEEVLSFDHFVRARRLESQGEVKAAVYALAIAIKERLTAEEMTTRFTDPPAIEPEILELQLKYPEWAWMTARQLLKLNGTRKEAEYHLGEFVRLVTTEEKS